MRKFIAFIGALLLAAIIVVGVNFFKQGYRLGDLSVGRVVELFGPVDDEPASGGPRIPGNTDVIPVDTSLSYEERIDKGHYFTERGFLDFAANEYAQAAVMAPNASEPYVLLMQTYFELGDYEKSLLNAQAAKRLMPGSSDIDVWIASIYIKQNQFAQAGVILNAVPQGEVPNGDIIYLQALLAAVENRHEAAEKHLNEAASLVLVSETAEKVATLQAAYKEFNFAQAGEELYLNELVGRAFNQIGEYELAIFKLKEVLKTRNDLRDAWILLGFSYLNLESYYFAQTAFEKAYELDSQWPATQYFLALTLSELEQREDAIVFLNYAINNGFEPEVVARKKLADLYLDNGEHARAVEAYENVLSLNEGDVNAYVRPIWIYLDFLNQPDQALELAKRASQRFPESPMALNLLGWAQTGTRDFVNAESNLMKALSLSPDMAAIHLNLGKVYQAQGKKSEAQASYQKAYDLDQNGSIGRTAAQRYNELENEN